MCNSRDTTSLNMWSSTDTASSNMWSSRDMYYVWDCSKKTPQHSQWSQQGQKSGSGYLPSQSSWNSPQSDYWGKKANSSTSSSSGSSVGYNSRSPILRLNGPSQQIGGNTVYYFCTGLELVLRSTGTKLNCISNFTFTFIVDNESY